jgi:hypothetical protein
LGKASFRHQNICPDWSSLDGSRAGILFPDGILDQLTTKDVSEKEASYFLFFIQKEKRN